MAEQHKSAFSVSTPTLPSRAQAIGASRPNEVMTISIYLKMRTEPQNVLLAAASENKLAALASLRDQEHAEDIRIVRNFASQNSLTVVSVEPVRRLVRLSGTVAHMEASFGTTLVQYTIHQP